MSMQAKHGVASVVDHRAENWLVEMILPGIFTMVLATCLAHLGYCVFQAQLGHPPGYQYAISAFAG